MNTHTPHKQKHQTKTILHNLIRIKLHKQSGKNILHPGSSSTTHVIPGNEYMKKNSREKFIM